MCFWRNLGRRQYTEIIFNSSTRRARKNSQSTSVARRADCDRKRIVCCAQSQRPEQWPEVGFENSAHRIEIAKSKLRDGRLSLSAVASACGLAGQGHLT